MSYDSYEIKGNDNSQIGRTIDNHMNTFLWLDDPRPDWDTYFLAMTYLIAQKSLDKHTKCGALAINKDKAILSTGYNSPPRGFPDKSADLERPRKYIIMEHAERNMVANAARTGTSLLDSTVYVTGPPCSDCYRIMWNAGVKRIVCGENLAKMTQNVEGLEDVIEKLGGCMDAPRVTKLETSESVISLLQKTLGYIETKLSELT